MKIASNQFLGMYKKELHSLCLSPGIAIAILLFLLSSGIPFLFPLSGISTEFYTFRNYISRIPFLLILIIPAFTMNIWMNERKYGIEQIRLSLPVPDIILVTGKFASLITVYLTMLLCTLPVSLLALNTDSGPIFSSYLLLFLYGSATLAIGQFLSSLFSRSIVSFMVTAATLFVLNTSHILPLVTDIPGWMIPIATQLSFAWHFEAAARGIIDSRDIFFYILPTLAFLLANKIHLANRRIQS